MTSYQNQPLSALPRYHYGLVKADPPWLHMQYGQKGYTEKHAASKYDLMTTEEICALEVQPLLYKHCLLWLWVPNAMVEHGLRVLYAWGFRFSTMGHWDKRTSFICPTCNTRSRKSWGTGRWLRSTDESFLIGSYGEPSVRSRSVPSSFDGERREHSRKPEECYHYAKMMRPGVPALDMFSREEREGWDNWGNEAKGSIDENRLRGNTKALPTLNPVCDGGQAETERCASGDLFGWNDSPVL